MDITDTTTATVITVDMRTTAPMDITAATLPETTVDMAAGTEAEWPLVPLTVRSTTGTQAEDTPAVVISPAVAERVADSAAADSMEAAVAAFTVAAVDTAKDAEGQGLKHG
jgi:hypothetical protein